MNSGNFAGRLRQLREAAGISRYRLAQLCGLSQVYLGELERGLKQPSLETARKLALALDQGSLACWD